LTTSLVQPARGEKTKKSMLTKRDCSFLFVFLLDRIQVSEIHSKMTFIFAFKKGFFKIRIIMGQTCCLGQHEFVKICVFMYASCLYLSLK
jgi:hypothetical protein